MQKNFDLVDSRIATKRYVDLSATFKTFQALLLAIVLIQLISYIILDLYLLANITIPFLDESKLQIISSLSFVFFVWLMFIVENIGQILRDHKRMKGSPALWALSLLFPILNFIIIIMIWKKSKKLLADLRSKTVE